MAGLFDLLNTVIGKITQNSVTYATAPTPPSGDDSTKVATTAFVADKTAAIPSGNVAVWSRDFTTKWVAQYKYNLYAPTGGTWFCWGTVRYGNAGIDLVYDWSSSGTIASGGAVLQEGNGNKYNTNTIIISNNAMAIKIA